MHPQPGADAAPDAPLADFASAEVGDDGPGGDHPGGEALPDGPVIDTIPPDLSADGPAPDAPPTDTTATDQGAPDLPPPPDQATPDLPPPPDQATPDLLPPDQAPPDQAPPDLAPDGSTGTVVHAWSEAFGSAGDDYGLAVAVDASGNVYVTGSFEGTVSFGGPALTSAGASDAFVVSLTSAGAHRWSQRFGDSGIDQGIDVAVDPTGNVYLTGAFSGTASFGGSPLTGAGATDAFVASLTTTGAHRWSAGFGAAADDSGNGVAVDASGNVAATGSFQGTASFGGTSLISAGAGDIFVASFTTSGTHRWSKRAGDNNDDAGYGIAADGAGNVYATGAFVGSADLGGGALAGAGKQDIFVASWTTLGAHRWSTGFGSNQDDAGLAAATDTVGNLFVAGWFQSSMSLGANNLSSAGAEDIFIASFTTAGAHRWSKSFGSTHEDMGQGVATDAQGNLCVAGYFHQTIDFGGGPLSSNGGRDIFVADYTTTGAHRWSNSYGSTTGISNDLGFDCAVDSAGNVYVVGVFRYPIDLGGGSLSNSGGNDAFLLKLAP